MNAVAPIEPYKLFAKINQNLAKSKPELEKLKLERAERASVPGRSSQPVGFASIGFAGFWPEGGGLLPTSSSKTSQVSNSATESDNMQQHTVAIAQ